MSEINDDLEKYNNTKCEYKLMAKCRLCGELFDVYSGTNCVVLSKKEVFDELYSFTIYAETPLAKIDPMYIHYHEGGSYGIGDFAGLIYEGEYKE